MKIKSIFAGLVLLATASITSAAVPPAGFSYNYVVSGVGYNAQGNVAWVNVKNSLNEQYSFWYIYTDAGNNIEEAKLLISIGALARSLNKKVGVLNLGAVNGHYVLGSLEVQE
ncbi:MAG TPA: hypothetical protein VJ385_00040 [Fibrobacteria bacterium]|nr:hypothetical protein [Fibrobacteria bacterium]